MLNKGNMAQLLKQARDVQKKIEEVQNELDELTKRITEVLKSYKKSK